MIMTPKNLLLTDIQARMQSLHTKLRDVAIFMDPNVRRNHRLPILEVHEQLENFRHSLDQHCVDRGLNFKFVELYRHVRIMKQIQSLLEEIKDKNRRSSWLMDLEEENRAIFWPYTDSYPVDSLYYISTSWFWMTNCIDIDASIRFVVVSFH